MKYSHLSLGALIATLCLATSSLVFAHGDVVPQAVDVSTLKELAKRWKPEAYTSFKKAQKHTALADVNESIDELAHYRKHLLSV